MVAGGTFAFADLGYPLGDRGDLLGMGLEGYEGLSLRPNLGDLKESLFISRPEVCTASSLQDTLATLGTRVPLLLLATLLSFNAEGLAIALIDCSSFNFSSSILSTERPCSLFNSK